MKSSFLSPEEVAEIGFKSYGEDVRISRHAQFYSPERMELGSHVRIDDFCLLSGRIVLSNYIHISAYSALYGGNAGVFMEDYTGVSGKCSVYAVSDDFGGGCIANAMADINRRNLIEKEVRIQRYAQVGAGATILPGVTIAEGACTGSMTLVNKDLEPWKIYVGVPCRILKDREPFSM